MKPEHPVTHADEEHARLAEFHAEHRPWLEWGPYLSERQWGTVREDYSATGEAWDSFPHDHARSRAYRWGEDGIAGVSDDQQRLCLALALWNGCDPIIKERLFGLTGPEGNHGEDVKEAYYHLDATPTASYLRALYKYPQRPFPYSWLVEENRRRSNTDPEFEIHDTNAFDDDRYFDVFVEYAKGAPRDILMRITAVNRGPDPATLHILPQLWFRNTWSWTEGAPRPRIDRENGSFRAAHPEIEDHFLVVDTSGAGGVEPTSLFCDNDTNVRRLFNTPGDGPFKDGINDYLVHQDTDAARTDGTGTKLAIHVPVTIAPGASVTVRLRLAKRHHPDAFVDFDSIFEARIGEADAFYNTLQRDIADAEQRKVHRQACAGLIWSKQFYYFDVPRWLRGDPAQPAPPECRKHGRNHEWVHLNNADIISMPDTWEYPWYAAWDLAFHCITLATLDPRFAKDQLLLLTREWYMHPNGQLPAYEWAFGDVNPPVHAWATWRVFEIDREQRGDTGDLAFLERVFHKLMLNFTWWVNRKDQDDRNIFQGGFLGLDNIGVFDRSAPLPTGGHIDQADGTSWMAMYCLNLLRIALELARHNHVYEDIATKFFEHFLHIAEALNNIANQGVPLWDDRDQFFYDVLHLPDGQVTPLRVRSMVGLIPLFAVEVIDGALLDELPGFAARLEWYLNYRPELASLVSHWHQPGSCDRRLVSLLRAHRMKRSLARLLDPDEFLSDYGLRALSRVHLEQPFIFWTDGTAHTVRYTPAESDCGLFGGNSNWRGPIWFPLNFLVIESLRKFHRFYGNDFKVECPTRSGNLMTLDQVADEIARRLTRIFLPDEHGRRPVYGNAPRLSADPAFNGHLQFFEYFHGDTGRGVGASHQTGWTALIATVLEDLGREKEEAASAPETVRSMATSRRSTPHPADAQSP